VEEQIRADVERNGFHLGVIPPEAGTPGWAFTIGLGERFGHPELLAFAPDPDFLGRLVATLAQRVRGGDRFQAGCTYGGVLSDREVAMREVERTWYACFLGNVAWHYGGEDFAALQCFWPDRSGLFPWDEGFDPRWREQQPLLYLQETPLALSEPLIGVLRKEGAL
jgi:hypothetical protein